MFGFQPCLSIDFYFPLIRGTKRHQHVDQYIAELCEQLWEAFKEAQVQSLSENERQKQSNDRKANAISLEPGDLVLAKANTYRGKRKVKDQWDEKWSTRLLKASLPTSWRTSRQDAHESSTKTDFFSSLLQRGLHSVQSCELSGPMYTTTTLEEQTLEGNETEEAPQSVNCPLPAQHQTGETPLGWVNRKLYTFLQTFLGTSLLDKG